MHVCRFIVRHRPKRYNLAKLEQTMKPSTSRRYEEQASGSDPPALPHPLAEAETPSFVSAVPTAADEGR